jgi:nicotinate-nucleotide adenylyltransferase
MQVAVLGGSFDPPHAAHVLMAAYLGTIATFEHVIVVPVFEHAFEKNLTAFEHRLRMCQLAFEKLPFVEVTPIEATLKRPNYTLHTLDAIKRAHPSWQLRLAMGADVLAESRQWHAFDEVMTLAPPFVFERHGTPSDGKKTCLLPQVSSTELRGHLLGRHQTEASQALEDLLPESVRQYIDDLQLYR